MKFLLLTFIALLINLCATSQVEFNIFGGPQATTANYKINGIRQETKMKFGFNAGAGLKVPFENKLFFAPVAFYSMKGYTVTYTQFNALPDINAKDNNTTIHTFTLGVLLQYDFNTTPSHFFIKAGPSLDFQLFGNEKFNLMAGGTVDRKMKFSFADYGFVSGNVLLQLGYETSSGFIIYGQYDHGLSSISNLDGGPQIKHRAFGISIGKYLNRKKIIIDTRNKE